MKIFKNNARHVGLSVILSHSSEAIPPTATKETERRQLVKSGTKTMQAIITKYLSPTNVRCSKIKATCERGSLTIDFPYYDMDIGDAHRSACDALCASFDAEDLKKYGSNQGHWSKAKASGQLPSGEYVFCFIQDRVANR